MVGSGRQARFGVKGTRQGKVTVWRGVPYAAAPTGEGRFQPPRPSDPWDGPRNADEYGPSSISTEVPGLVLPSGSGVQPESEDCLYLNVWSPRARSKPRPVLVWIHGGAFVFGSGSNFDGAWLASRGDVVVVTINYRLGPWGFLDLATVAGAGFESAVNVGLLDQVAALTWVRDNIEAFGGDPDRVTVIGQASGANCVGALLAMPAARGLFHRAVLQSGGADRVQNRWRSRAVVVRMLNALGLDYRDAHRMAGLPVAAVRTAAGNLLRDSDDAELESEPFLPTVDGAVLPGHPLAGLGSGASAQVPLLVSTCRDEANLYLAISPEGFIKAKELRARAWYGDVAWDRLAATYQRGALAPERGRADLLTDLLFGLPAVRTAEAHSRGGGRVWMMRFDHTPGQVPFDQLGPCHGSDLPFTWLDYTGPADAAFPGLSTTADRTVAETLQDVIVSFARTGDPGTAMLPAWPSYQPGRRAVMSISSRSALELDPAAERRRAWDGLPLPQTLNVRRTGRPAPTVAPTIAPASGVAQPIREASPDRAASDPAPPAPPATDAGPADAHAGRDEHRNPDRPPAGGLTINAPAIQPPTIGAPSIAAPTAAPASPPGPATTSEPVPTTLQQTLASAAEGETSAQDALRATLAMWGDDGPLVEELPLPEAMWDPNRSDGEGRSTPAPPGDVAPPTMAASLEELESGWGPPPPEQPGMMDDPTGAADPEADPEGDPEGDNDGDEMGQDEGGRGRRRGRLFRPRRGSGRSPNG
ncbi:MAG TPA: carboxylesterase family protein [Acidimicrobiales bacterium]|nr:carboxylesterase family protein [Acidimicrobiales bacterium]